MTKVSSSISIAADIDELQRKINEVRKQREAIGHENQSKSPLKRRPKSPDIKKKKKNKDALYHPNLAYILGEIVHSPYMTSPLEKYPSRTFTIVEELRALKREGKKYKDLPKERRPYKIGEIKKTFVKEVVEFKPCYTTNVRQPSSREGSPNSRPTSSSSRGKLATGGQYKSGMLKAAEARGGPATYRKRLTVLKHKAFEDQKQILSSTFDPSLLNAFADEAIFGSKSSPNLVHFADDEVSLVASREKLLSRRQNERNNSASTNFFQEKGSSIINNNDDDDDGNIEYDYEYYDDSEGLGDFISIDVINNEEGPRESIEIDDMQGTIPEDGQINMYDEDNFEIDDEINEVTNTSKDKDAESNNNNEPEQSSVVIDETDIFSNDSADKIIDNNNYITTDTSTNNVNNVNDNINEESSEIQYVNDFDSTIGLMSLEINNVDDTKTSSNINDNVSSLVNDNDDDISVITIQDNHYENDKADLILIKQLSSQISAFIIDSEVQKWADLRKNLSPERRKSIEFIDRIVSHKIQGVIMTTKDDNIKDG